ncbi:hypothetical protein ASG90_05385 [Nocardioides sp. Soil797]|nr:hypothetical protein ASG90_05385 [Nocardioides sp. Soil797]
MSQADDRASTTLWRRIFPRPVAVLLVVVLAVQALLLIAIARSASFGEPHDLPIAVVTAPVVADALADQANAMEGRPFEAAAARDSTAARESVERGTAAAWLEVDLRRTRDVLVLNAANGKRLNDAILDRIRAVEASYDRTVVVRELDTSHGSSHRADTLALLAHVIAFVFVVVVSLLFGPVTRTLGRGLLRHLALAGVAVVASTALAVSPLAGPGEPSLLVIAVLLLSILVVGSATLALEALAGLSGLGVAAVLFVVQAAPLLLQTDTRLFPRPWPAVIAVTPVGAMERALANLVSYEDGPGIGRPVLVLWVWLAIALLTSLVARRVRDRAGVDLRTTGRPASRRTKVLWRWRVGAVVIPAAALLLGLTLLVPRGAIAGPDALPSRASETRCVPTGPVRNVKDMNRITTKLRGGGEFQSGFQGGDVGASVMLQDGRALFVFGDTLRSADFQGQRFVRNSMLVMEPDCLQVVVPADHGAIIPDRAANGDEEAVGYWPMSIGRDSRPGYDLVAVAAQRVRSTGSGEFDFESLGSAVAVFIVPRGGTPQLIDRVDLGPDRADRTRPVWGAASTVHDGWAYLYGTANPGEELVFGYSLSVARVRPDDILDRSRWRYWNGDDWVRREDEAAALIPAEGGVSQTLSVFEQDGTWFALSKRDEFLGTDLTVWTAPSPTGPFTAGESLAHLPSDTVKGQLRYMPLAHPEFLPRKGTMVVSYSRNRTDINEVIDDPMSYRPRFLRVRLRP